MTWPNLFANQTILVVAAHPDDEALGCGGTIARATAAGASVHALFFTDGVGSRAGSAADEAARGQRAAAAAESLSILGAAAPTLLDYPDNQLDMVALLELSQQVAVVVDRLQPAAILTHHAEDLNVDHRRVHEAVMTACRPQPGRAVATILCFEVPSSTEWRAPRASTAFLPQVYVDISAQLGRKRQALEAYREEMRAWPHARSIEAVEHLARWRGASAGVEAAEAFMVARMLF